MGQSMPSGPKLALDLTDFKNILGISSTCRVYKNPKFLNFFLERFPRYVTPKFPVSGAPENIKINIFPEPLIIGKQTRFSLKAYLRGFLMICSMMYFAENEFSGKVGKVNFSIFSKTVPLIFFQEIYVKLESILSMYPNFHSGTAMGWLKMADQKLAP